MFTFVTRLFENQFFCRQLFMNRILLFTSALFLTPIYFSNFDSNIYSEILFILLFLTFAFSQMFWSDPVKQSVIHIADSFMAKLTFLAFLVYTVYIGNATINYLLALLAIGVFFYLSDHFSRLSWCSQNHIVCHGLAHVCCAYAITFAFV